MRQNRKHAAHSGATLLSARGIPLAGKGSNPCGARGDFFDLTLLASLSFHNLQLQLLDSLFNDLPCCPERNVDSWTLPL